MGRTIGGVSDVTAWLEKPRPSAHSRGPRLRHIALSFVSRSPQRASVRVPVARSLVVGARGLGWLSGVFGFLVFGVASAFAAPPEVPVTGSASGVSSVGATLNGVLNPGGPGEVGEYHFSNLQSESECEPGFVVPEPPGVALGGEGEAVSAVVGGLQPNASYTFCVVASNAAAESAVGGAVSFKTLAAAPLVDGEGVSAVNAVSATLEAQVNANNEASSYSFEYSTEATGEELEGTVRELAGTEGLPALFGDQRASVATGEELVPGTRYFYRVVASNAQSELEKTLVRGVVQSFVTPPEALTDPVASVGATSAVLNGHFTLDEVAPTSYLFFYNFGSESCQGAFATEQVEAGSGTTLVSPAVEVTGLVPFQTYTACLATLNASGFDARSAVSFKTLALPPAIDGESSSAVTSTGATLAAQVNTENQETGFVFEYSTEAEGEELEGTIVKVPGAAPLPAGVGDVPAIVNTETLQPRTAYFYRVVATNASNETTAGKVETFTTLDAPLVTDEAAKSVTRTKALVSGTVNPGGLTTHYRLVYVDAAHYNPGALECPQEVACAYSEHGKASVSEQLTGSDYAAHPVGPFELEELKPGTTYHYALLASNEEGTRISPDQTFTTPTATPPSASTGEASAITQTSATLDGSVDLHGLPGALFFEVGLTPESGELQAASIIPGSQNATSFGITLTYNGTLTPGTTYYYRTVVSTADGTATGETRSFTTATVANPFTLPLASPVLQFTSITSIETKEAQEHPPAAGKHSTNTQKLKKALAACRKQTNKTKRHRCEHQARKRYA